jgi:hypothetical protein
MASGGNASTRFNIGVNWRHRIFVAQNFQVVGAD